MDNPQCYCGSGLPFLDCCSPLLAGIRPAATAEALMRSRYTANVLKNTGYLLKTWHSSTRPAGMDGENIPVWCGLTVLAVYRGRQGDRQGMVEFSALYKTGAGMGVLHERSRFVFEKSCWFYVDGDLLESPARQSEKISRNGPCSCGSGKKFKRCCLK